MREVLRSEARSTSLIAVVRVEIRKYEHHHHHHQYYHHNTAKQNGEFANIITTTISIITITRQNKMVNLQTASPPPSVLSAKHGKTKW